MALFEKKDSAPQIPGLAECDARLAQLAQRAQETIYRLGLKYAENNTAAGAADTIYAGELRELEAISQEKNAVEVKRLALQGLRKCEKCGNVLIIDSVFCNKCGEKLQPLQTDQPPRALHCPQCGSPLKADAAFCSSCGHKL